MNSRERMSTTLNHRQPDKVAIDFGGTNCSTMHVSCIDELRKYYGLPDRVPKVLEVYTMIGEIEDDLRKIIGSDTVGIMGMNTTFGFPRENWKKWTTPQGLEVLVPGGFNMTADGEGGYYAHPQGDINAPPSGHMPAGGYYFDGLVRQEPFDDENLNPEDNLEGFTLLNDAELEYFKDTITQAWETGEAVVVNMPGMGLGDAAEVHGCNIKYPKGIRDLEEWYVSPLIRPDYVKAVFEKQTEIAIKNMKAINELAGDKIDVAFTCAADFAHQSNTFFSAEIFRNMYLPYFKKANDWIHSNTKWKILKHCCGAIEPFIPMLIEAGFDALNPVQCSARGMEAEHLKKEYGNDIVFWGGGVDTQNILSFGSPEEVRKQVLERCEIFSKNGGFVFNSVHEIQAKTTIKNIVAMIDAVHEFNGDK